MYLFDEQAHALTAQELARIRNEKAAVERQINQLTPQIARLEREQAEFSRNPENIRTAQQTLAIAVQNEIDNALPIWQNTHRSNHRNFFHEQTRLNEISRRRGAVELEGKGDSHQICKRDEPNMIQTRKLLLPLAYGMTDVIISR